MKTWDWAAHCWDISHVQWLDTSFGVWDKHWERSVFRLRLPLYQSAEGQVTRATSMTMKKRRSESQTQRSVLRNSWSFSRTRVLKGLLHVGIFFSFTLHSFKGESEAPTITCLDCFTFLHSMKLREIHECHDLCVQFAPSYKWSSERNAVSLLGCNTKHQTHT